MYPQRGKRSARALVMTTVALLLLTMLPAHAAGGALDKSFGSLGFSRIKFDTLGAVAVQRDGKVLTAGWGGGSSPDFQVTRRTANGGTDPTFASGKIVKINFGRNERAFAIAEAPGGKIVVAGSSIQPFETSSFAVARLTSRGALDKTFGGDGKITTDAFDVLDDGSFAGAMAVQPDGKILVAGHASASVFFSQPFAAVVRYNTDGSLDPTFGTGGVATAYLGDAYVNRMRVLSDGRIVVVGAVLGGDGSDFMVARLLPTGEPDVALGGVGSIAIDFGREDWATGLGVASGGKLVVAGLATVSGSHQIGIVRLLDDGSFDTTFSKDGKAFSKIGPEGGAFDLAMQSDGKALVAWTFCEGGRKCIYAAVTRFTKTGSIDTSYGSKGVARPWGKALGCFPAGLGAYGGAIALQKGKLLVGGTMFSTMGIARLTA